MPLSPGSRLGPYEVGAKLGSGGMGEVYSAHDSRLERTVAIKVLPDSVADDPVRRRRFEREAKAVAALNHPHICTLYEVGEEDGQAFLVMEHIEGRPLRQLIPGHGLPTETVLHYGVQIADALAFAHDHNVVHRDLKSSNVMVTPSGSVKVVDFGLAKHARGVENEEAPTATMSLTGAGRVVGTLPYMAPEVLVGDPADARSDIWSLGVLLHLMITGTMPFVGRTAFELTAAIQREPPAPIDPRVPAGLRAVVRRCLAKEPGQRYQRASEVQAALDATRVQLAFAAADGSREQPEDVVTAGGGVPPTSGGAGPAEVAPPAHRPLAHPVARSDSSVETQTLLRIASSLVPIMVMARVVGVVVVGIVVLGLLGLVTGASFDLALRVPSEGSALDDVILGGHAVIPVVVRMLLVCAAVAPLVALSRILPERSGKDRRRRLGDRIRRAVDAAEPSQVVAAFVLLCAVALAVVAAVSWRLLDPIWQLVELPADTVVDTSALGEAGYGYQSLASWVSAAVILILVGGWVVTVSSLRRRASPPPGLRLMHVGAAATVLCALLLAVAPWRLVFANDREQVEFKGHRAFIVSRVENRLYLYVPGVPDNRVQVFDDDPRVVRSATGVTADIFGSAP